MIPDSVEGDPQAIVELLQRARELWKNAERLEAIQCLKDAASAAGEAGKQDRATQLTLAATDAEAVEVPTLDVDVSQFRK
jgi:hypothetical protein